MKRLFALLTAVLLMFTCVASTTALESPTSVEHYAVRTLINGTGEASSNVASVEIGSDEAVILTATEIYKSFSFWDIDGEYTLVSGDLNGIIVAIKPKSDIIAIATFEDGIVHYDASKMDSSHTSPQTGDNGAVFWILAGMVASAGVVIGFSARNSMRKKK